MIGRPVGAWDPGRQPERNNLAWRRTALGITAGMAIGARLLTAPHPWLGIALPAAAVVTGAALFAAAGVRSRRLDRDLRAVPPGGGPSAAPSGRLLLVTAAFAALLAAAAAGLILTGHVSADR
ncbi:DUF202 domain-containing protein [Glycomyces tarimensis]